MHVHAKAAVLVHLCISHNAPALLFTPAAAAAKLQHRGAVHYATRRAPVKNHNGVTLCCCFFIYCSRRRDCLAYQVQNQRPLISILISSPTPWCIADSILSYYASASRFARA